MNKLVKKEIIGIICICILATFGCKKEDGSARNIATAILNGQNWEAQADGIIDVLNQDHFTFQFTVYNQSGFLRESLGFRSIPISKGRYQIFPDSQLLIEPTTRYGTFLSDGDVSAERYIVLDNKLENFIQIDSINIENKIVCGTFECLLFVHPFFGKFDPNAPDSICFEHGEFMLQYTE